MEQKRYGVDEMIEIHLNHPDDFLRIKETLTRMGVCSNKDNTLYQSCHILHKKGHYYIVHFKEMFKLDGREADFSEEDQSRRNTIIRLLEEWKLCKVAEIDTFDEMKFISLKKLKVLPFKEKDQWTLASKYTVGK